MSRTECPANPAATVTTSAVPLASVILVRRFSGELPFGLGPAGAAWVSRRVSSRPIACWTTTGSALHQPGGQAMSDYDLLELGTSGGGERSDHACDELISGAMPPDPENRGGGDPTLPGQDALWAGGASCESGDAPLFVPAPKGHSG